MRTPLFNKAAYISLYLAILCLLSVIAFLFPEYLTNPMLREAYDADQLRILLFVVLYIAFGLSLTGLILSPLKAVAAWALILVATAAILGGAGVEVQTPIAKKPVYLSLDLIILDLFFMSLIFVPLERFFYLRNQRFLRPGLATDLAHYGINHLLMGGVYFLIAFPGDWIHKNVLNNRVPELMDQIPVFGQVFVILFIADFSQYWIHRFFHKRMRFWQFHKIHHSSQLMDWLSSSRLHIVDVIMTRAFSYIPIVCLGFSQDAVQIYIPIIAMQALFVHSNVRFNFGPLRYVFTTPLVHHWHHSNAPEAVNKNFAVTFSIIDVMFKTYYCPNQWPENYGLHEEQISQNFMKQLIYPFLEQLPPSHTRVQA